MEFVITGELKLLRDRDIHEENEQLLTARWELLREPGSRTDGMRLGMSPVLTEQIRDLDEIQMKRACDCSSPLFNLSVPEDVIRNALSDPSGVEVSPFDRTDKIIENENYIVLTNRWACVKSSPIHAQCTFGMTRAVIEILQNATLADIRSASRKGFRMVGIAPKPKYFFHAGRNLGLKRPQRTAIAVCTSAQSFF